MPKAPKVKVGKAVIHPNSRQASQLTRQSHHETKKQKSKSDTSIKQEQLRQKLQWFQDNMDPQKTSFTKHDLAVMVTDYLDRFKDELEQIGIVNTIGNRQSKQHVSRETAIRLTEEREKNEFEGPGVEVPDLINGKHLNYFRNWTGEVRYFPNIKLRRIRKSDLNIQTAENEEEDESELLPDYVEEQTDRQSEDLPDLYVEEQTGSQSNNLPDNGKEETYKQSEDLPDYVDKD